MRSPRVGLQAAKLLQPLVDKFVGMGILSLIASNNALEPMMDSISNLLDFGFISPNSKDEIFMHTVHYPDTPIKYIYGEKRVILVFPIIQMVYQIFINI